MKLRITSIQEKPDSSGNLFRTIEFKEIIEEIKKDKFSLNHTFFEKGNEMNNIHYAFITLGNKEMIDIVFDLDIFGYFDHKHFILKGVMNYQHQMFRYASHLELVSRWQSNAIGGSRFNRDCLL